MLPKRIVALGSSSIYGRGDDEWGGFIHRLRLWYESLNTRFFVYSLGIFGEGTDRLIQRVAVESAPRRPELIILYPGFNDIRREGSMDAKNVVSLEVFMSSMEKLIDEAQSLSPVLMLTGVPFIESKTMPYLQSNSYYLSSDAEYYSQGLRDVCAKKGAMLLDFFQLWETVPLEEVLHSDGLHCNALGHKLLFEQLKRFILEQYTLQA
ncbi:GDSL-type esterase/lipase family protein [Shewanella surugensis]|uniref:GDSL-type esterase/lipase family protein n=1 Tax=Shewanella surugensis TaxID=212020 RepID=A0ABT0LF94_9GAMM|nr:GDSL-type esterase/lipase family protein [Shewanella surugensis]MCL1125826.1 GDSL-type esterase/lipase family protein [Shewanella surugensis]